MKHMDLRAWSGLFRRRDTVAWVRRSISDALAKGDTVIVYDTGAEGISEKVRGKIRRGWPAGKVRFPRPHPTLAPKPKARRGGAYLFA